MELAEHLNVVLFELARTYHAALQKVDVSGFGAHEQGIIFNYTRTSDWLITINLRRILFSQ